MRRAGSGAADAQTPGALRSFGGFGRRSRHCSAVDRGDFSGGIYGTSLPLASGSDSRQNIHTSNLEHDVHLPENKFRLSRDEIGTGGVLSSKFHKSRGVTYMQEAYTTTMEQLADLSLSKNRIRRTQPTPNNSKEGMFNSWTYTHDQSNTTVNSFLLRPGADLPLHQSPEYIDCLYYFGATVS
ncbi:protein FAM217A isoform X5 [Pelodiscus sinensis]|uniref:protein FAM217A isoform X5 n=1 Tax=Pelodiscus sinensis TaxID=13735 RepID=UPI003F6AC794